MTGRPRALALIDGEHYPEVVCAAFEAIAYDVIAAVALGGTEKLKGDEDYGVPVYERLEEALARAHADVVVDLSDEPVVTARDRFHLASRTLAAGLPYVGADFRFDPIPFAPFDVPALAVIGSGKRVGKTAVTGHVGRVLADSRDVVIVAMGRGGPPEPVVVEDAPTVSDLLERSRAGSHAASDYLEDAALTGLVTVGARRCGGGLAGKPFFSNVEEAARVAAARRPDLVVFEGSGAVVPPVDAGARILVARASRDTDLVAGYLGEYRLLLSDLVVLTSCEEPLASQGEVERMREAIADVNPDLRVVATVFRQRPTERVEGRRVALFTTAPPEVHDRIREHLEQEHGADIVHISGNLSSRAQLRRDLESTEVREADVYLVEIKAAAIDVVAEAASERGVEVVFADNEVLPVDGEPDLDDELRALADAAAREVAAAS
ncbi:MAG: cyclic 2,3-diphosphoglycerate synthetase [Actinomycetota bacterium]|nr:cyclic 2,3-diphosphoglycerate synthetase [Actinomycetota bacterium]